MEVHSTSRDSSDLTDNLTETLNYSKSKTCTAKKLNLYQPVYPISYTGWCSFLALQVLDLEQFKVSGDLVFAASYFIDSRQEQIF